MTLKQNSVCCLKWKTHDLYQPIVWLHSQTCDCHFRNLIGKRYSNQSTPPPKLTDASNYPFLKHGGHKTWFVLCPPGANIHTHIERVLHKKQHTVDRMLALLICCTTCTSCLPPNQPLKHLSPSSLDLWPAPHQWELCPLVEKHVCKQIHFNTDIEECYCHTTCCGSTCVVQCRGRTPD